MYNTYHKRLLYELFIVLYREKSNQLIICV